MMPDLYDSQSHFIRCAVIREVKRAETEMINRENFKRIQQKLKGGDTQ